MEAFHQAFTNSAMGDLLQDPEIDGVFGLTNVFDLFLELESDPSLRHLEMESLRLLQGEVCLGLFSSKDESIRPTIQTQQGQLTFGLRQPGPASDPPHQYLVAELSGADYQRLLALDERIAELSPTDIHRVVEEFRGVDLIYVRQRTPQGNTNQLWQAHLDDTLLLAHHRSWVEASITRIQQEAILPPSPPLETLSLSIRGGDLVQGAPRPAPAASASAPPSSSLMEALGLDELGTMTATLHPGPESLSLRLRLPTGDRPRGILALLDTPPLTLRQDLPYVEQDIHQVRWWRINLEAFWGELPSILRAIAPGMEQLLPLTSATLGDIRIDSDLLAHLGTRGLTLTRLRDGMPQRVRLLSLRNPAALEQTLKSIFAEESPFRISMGPAYEEIDFVGIPLYTFPSRNGGEGREATTIAAGTLVFGQADMVRSVLRVLLAERPAPSPFIASSTFHRMRSEIPDTAFAVDIIDWDAVPGRRTDPYESSASEDSGPHKKTGFMSVWTGKAPLPHAMTRYLGPLLQTWSRSDQSILYHATLRFRED